MGLWNTLSFMAAAPVRLLLGINKASNEMYRAGFAATALAEGLLQPLAQGPVSADQLLAQLGAEGDSAPLAAWLDVGVSLGELAKSPQGYRVKGGLCRQLAVANDDAWAAFLQSRVQTMFPYLLQTPALLRSGGRLPLTDGELIARASRTVEPLLLGLIDRIVPASGPCRILEVGCGSGVYIKRACERSLQAQVTGIELQDDAAQLARANIAAWGLSERASVRTVDIRAFDGGAFDLITMHNLIYYFTLGERTQLLAQLREKLAQGGQLVLTSMCQGEAPAFRMMNLWASMTEGSGPLPISEELEGQLRQAGFAQVATSSLMPGLVVFEASR